MNPKDDPEYDEWCDPDNPRKVKYEGILAASKRIVGQIVRTPLQSSHVTETGFGVILKGGILPGHRMNSRLESAATAGHIYDMHMTWKAHIPKTKTKVSSFVLTYNVSSKINWLNECPFLERGVCNTLSLLSDEQKKYGVAAASTGNHACALAHHSTRLGIPSIVYMPMHAPINKVNKAERQGGKIVLHGSTLAETKLFAMTKSKEKKMMYINGFDHPNIIEGQGTIGIEVIEQLPSVDAVLVPCGGGSLLAGIAIAVKHLKPDTEVYGIVTDHTNSMVEALRKNERVFINLEPSIADGLSVNKVGVNTFFNLKGVVDKMVVVREDWVARAIMHIIEEEKVVVEGAGAVGVASILAGLFPNLKGKKVVAICSGGNIDSTTLSRALERGMAAEGRLVKFKVTVSDRPGGLADLCGLLANSGITMRDCVPERAWVKGDVFSVQLKVIVETRGWDHTKDLVELIKKNYKEYFFQEMGEKSDKTAGTKRGPCLAPNPMCMQK